MPLSRYQIRNEYSLADPELYRAADKDDPEALLEGVAMAGLVGVLRQLGDLAEFAAEVFHDLHEEVIATAARGHSLMVRVQQLEAEFPSIEKAFLSQTNHSSFFYNAGIDWHPNMHMDQNLITQGDMPRFIMDSYEESRGPPRLFLLDKFDVAGAGACLKRYTDPSFFKVETSALEITNADVQRDKRTRKGKKKGSRWRNGETPEVLPTPHAKLHQLLLEERIENTTSDPARHVKLKRRLNGFPFDSRTGESYMERFLKNPSPEHKVVHEISVCSSPLKLPANSTYESGLDVHDISSQSPDKKFRYGSPSLTPDMEGTVQKLSVDKLNGNYESPKANRSFEEDDILSTFPEEVGEKEIAVDGETKTGGSIDGYQSDDVASEVDNYVDALATMESEIDTDSELRPESDLRVLSDKRRMSGFDATEAEHQQASFSDSQSMGSSLLSEDGNSMFKKEISSSSYSDTRSISAENTPLEGEVFTEGFLFNDICKDKGTARSPKQEQVNEDMELAPSTEHANDDGGTKVAETPAYMSNHRDQTMSNLTILQPTSAQMDAESTLREHAMLEGKAEEMLYAHNGPETELGNNTGSETNLNVCVPSDALQTKDDSSPRVFARNWANDDSDDRYLNVGDSLPYDLSDIPSHARDASSLADSAKSQHLEDLKSEENLSLSSTNQPLDESGDNNSNMTEHPPKWSPEGLPVNRLDREDPSVISGASDVDQDILSDSSVHLPNTLNIAPEDEKSKNSLGNIPQTENSEDNHMENQVDNLISLPISIAPHAEEQSLQCSLPELETCDTVLESDNKFSAPDDVILPATEEQPVGQSLPEHDTHDTVKESDHIVSDPDDVAPPAAEEAVYVSSVMESPKDVHSEDLHISGITDDIQPLATVVNSTENQIDLPIPVISHLDEKSLEISVNESAKDAHSKDLQISGTTDNIQPPDPAVNLTEDQIDSRIPAISHLDDESVDLTQSEVETHSKGAEPDNVIPDVNNMISPAGEIAGDIKPIMESPNLCDLRKLQASAILEDIPQLDSAEAGISCNGEQNLHECPSSEDGVETDGLSRSTDLVETDAADFVIPPDCKSLPSNVNLTDADAKRDEADTASRAGFDENANDSDSELDVHKELGTPKVASQVSGSDLSETLCHDDTEPEALGNAPDSCSQVESSLDLGNATATSSPLQQSGLGTIAIPSQKSDLTEYTEDISLLPTHHDAEEQKVKLSFGELDKGDTKVLQNAAEANLESLLQLEQEGSFDHLDEEGYTNTASVALLANRSSQPSVSELLPEDNGNIGDIGRPKDPFSSSTGFGLLPEAKIKLEEMPPLPPLPPVQWRMGKLQHNSSVQEKEALPSIVGAFPSLSPSMADQKAQSSKPFLPRYDIAGENSHLVYEYTSQDPVSEGPFLSQLPPMGHHENNTNRLPPAGETQSVNQLLPLPEKLDKIPEDDFHVGEKEKVQPRLVTFSEGISLDIASTYASKLPDDETTRLQHQIAPETSSKDEKLDQCPAHPDGNIVTHDDPSQLQHQVVPETSSKDEKLDQGSAHSDGNIVTHDEPSKLQHQVAQETSSKNEKLDQGSAHSDGKIITRGGHVVPSKIENEQPQNVMSSPMGEIAWPAQDDGKANGGRTTKLPRPRNPLIDAVVAHDKSKLRKVTEHPRPQIHKADERDSVLEQIRAKSFNLKPTIVSRPSIQGPTTNLKVAAILEKAKTIRQAFVGSDEDDDDDSWSDS